jgi:hypothetical protein
VTVLFPIAPQSDEYFAGFLVRATAENHYHHPYEILMEAQVNHQRPGTFGLRRRDQLAPLAAYMQVDVVALEQMFMPAGRRPGTFKFHGSVISKQHLETTIRRVSPRGLRTSPYSRAIWQLRPFSFDPVTKEQLLCSCPECGRAFGFERTLGVAYCDWCETADQWGFPGPAVDLRDYPQPLVEVNDPEALDFVVGLVDKYLRDRAPRLPIGHPFGVEKFGDIFEFVIALACAMTQPPDRIAAGIRRPDTLEESARLEPDLLARAGRAVLDWPKTFGEICVEASARREERDGHYGVYKEYGPLALLSKDIRLTGTIRALVKGQIGDAARGDRVSSMAKVAAAKLGLDDQFITTVEAAKLFKMKKKLLERLGRSGAVTALRGGSAAKSPVLFVLPEITEVVTESRSLEYQSLAADRLGIGPDVLFELAADGTVELGTGSALILTAKDGRYYRRATLDRLVEQVTARAVVAGPNFVPLRKAMLAYPPNRRPWLEVMRGMARGEVRVALGTVEKRGIFGELLVPESTRFPSRRGRPAFPVEEPVTLVEIGLILGVQEVVAQAFAAAGAFGAIVGNITYGHIVKFAEEYALAGEVAERAGVSVHALEKWLRDRGVASVELTKSARRRLVFPRAAVDALLGPVP